jgi:hypothetical protein
MTGREPNLKMTRLANINGTIAPIVENPRMVPQVAKLTPSRSMYSGTHATELSVP